MADGDPVVGDLSAPGTQGTLLPPGYGMPSYGYGGLGFQDPAWTGAQMRQKYAMALLQQGMATTPVASPWAAVARAVQGGLGGWEMGEAQKQMQQQNQQWQQELAPSQKHIQDILDTLSGGFSGGQRQQAQGGGPPAQRSDGPGMEQPASLDAIKALPDVQALPVSLQPLLAEKMASNGLGINAAAQYARMVRQESGGSNIDAKTGEVIKSPAGAVGVGQLMPATFSAMQKKYGLSGDITDPGANLDAGVHYFKEGLDATKGDLAGGAVYYNAGPGGLASYKSGGNIPAETVSYLASTRAPSAPGFVSGQDGQGGYTGFAPGSGPQAAIMLRAEAFRLAQNPLNPYAQALSRNLLAMIPQIAPLGAVSPPQPVPGQPGVYRTTNLATGATTTGGEQSTAVTQGVTDMNTLNTLGKKPWASMTPQEQTTYQGAYTRIGRPDVVWNDKTGWTMVPNPSLPPNITVPPGAVAGATPGGGGPGGAAVTPPTTVPGTLTPQVSKQIDADQTVADTTRQEALAVPRIQMMTQQIRALMQKVPTGYFAPMQMELGKILAGLGYDSGTVQKATQGMNREDGELLNKLLMQFSTEGARQLGAHEPGSVIGMFRDAYPNLESRGLTIDEFTRASDMQGQFLQRRSELMQQWLAEHRSDPNYRAINSQEFNNWAKTQGLDPRIYTSAALMAAQQPHSVYASMLGTGDEGEANLAKAKALARSFWGPVPIMNPQGVLVAPGGQR